MCQSVFFLIVKYNAIAVNTCGNNWGFGAETRNNKTGEVRMKRRINSDLSLSEFFVRYRARAITLKDCKTVPKFSA